MDQHANPIDFLIDFAWANGADRFTVNNAKDELEKLRQVANSFYPAAWIKVNDRGDLYDPRLCFNPFTEDVSIPLYANKQEFEAMYGKNSK